MNVGAWTVAGRLTEDRLGPVYVVQQAGMGRAGAMRPIDPEMLERFGVRDALRDLARRLAVSEHPGLVQVLDLVAAGDHWYLVSDLVPGPRLADLLDPATAAQRIGGWTGDPGSAATVALDTAETLLALHRSGLAHGAVSVEAVTFGADGGARLTDTGLLALLSGTAADPAADRRAWADLVRRLGVAWVPAGSSVIASLERAAQRAAPQDGSPGDLERAIADIDRADRSLPGGYEARPRLRGAVQAWIASAPALQPATDLPGAVQAAAPATSGTATILDMPDAGVGEAVVPGEHRTLIEAPAPAAPPPPAPAPAAPPAPPPPVPVAAVPAAMPPPPPPAPVAAAASSPAPAGATFIEPPPPAPGPAAPSPGATVIDRPPPPAPLPPAAPAAAVVEQPPPSPPPPAPPALPVAAAPPPAPGETMADRPPPAPEPGTTLVDRPPPSPGATMVDRPPPSPGATMVDRPSPPMGATMVDRPVAAPPPAATSRPGGPSFRLGGAAAPDAAAPAETAVPYAAPPPPPAEAPPPAPPPPPAAGGVRFGQAPQSAASGSELLAGAAADTTTPTWQVPTRQGRRRSRTWLYAGLVALAGLIVVGVVVGLVTGKSSPLSVSSAVVSVDHTRATCSQPVTVSGTIQTNGGEGTVEYQWKQDGVVVGGVQQQPVSKGQNSVTVHLVWTLTGKGTRQAVATLTISKPNPLAPVEGRFAYSC